jgi:hypothetical protein
MERVGEKRIVEEKRSEKRKDQRRERVRRRRCSCAKRKESREILCFSNDLWLRRVEK